MNMPAWSRLNADTSIECLACNNKIDQCHCIWSAIRDLQSYYKGITKDICTLIDELREHQKLPHAIPLYGKNWIQPESVNLFGKDIQETNVRCAGTGTVCNHEEDMKWSWTKVCMKCKASIGVDMAESKENPSRKVLEQKLHDKNLRIEQLVRINAVNKGRIEKLECELLSFKKLSDQKDEKINKICAESNRLFSEVVALKEERRRSQMTKNHGGCCL
jgi:hypothetical protein